MKVLHSVLFLYFTIFYIVGSNNLSSLMDHIGNDIVFCLKDIKKKTSSDKQENEQESEQEEEIGALCETDINWFTFYAVNQKKSYIDADHKVLDTGLSVIIPPPEVLV